MRPASRADRACLPRRHAGPAGAGCRLAAGGHATRRGRGRRRAARRARRYLAGTGADGRAAAAAGGGPPAARDPRRLALDGSRACRARRLERALGAAGRHLLPPRAPFPGRSPELCRRRRHRPQPEARGAGQGGRSASPHRRPHVGDALILLHAARHPCAGAAPRACASGSGGAGPGVRAHARHPGFADCLLRGLARNEPGAGAHPGTTRQPRRTPTISTGRSTRSSYPARSSMARPWSGCASDCRPMR